MSLKAKLLEMTLMGLLTLTGLLVILPLGMLLMILGRLLTQEQELLEQTLTKRS